MSAKDSKPQYILSLASLLQICATCTFCHFILPLIYKLTCKLYLELSRSLSFFSCCSKQRGGIVFFCMEAKLLPQTRSPMATALRRIHKRGCSPILAVLARPAENIAGITEKLILKPAENKTFEVAEKTSVHNDNWFDLMAINHLSQSLQAATGSFLCHNLQDFRWFRQKKKQESEMLKNCKCMQG